MKTYFKQLPVLDLISLIILGLFFVAFPLLFTSQTTDAFSIPKQTLLGGVTLISLFIWGINTVNNGTLKMRRTIFDGWILLFTGIVFLSSLFSVNRMDSVISFVPFFFSVLLYFALVNSAKREQDLNFWITSFVVSGVGVSMIAILSYLKIYILPSPLAKTQYFTPLGSILDQAVFLTLILLVLLWYVWNMWTSIRSKQTESVSRKDSVRIKYLIAFSAIITMGLIFTIIEIFGPQKPYILPIQTGFQTAFAAISQDTTRSLWAFLFGSGYGTYSTVFTKFKQTQFNLDNTLWSLTFYRSSSFFFEILATVGVLGIISFLLLGIKILRSLDVKNISRKFESNPFILPVLALIIASLLLPFSPTLLTLLFVFLGLYVLFQSFKAKDNNVMFDVELFLVAFSNGILAIEDADKTATKKHGKLLPVLLLIVIMAVSGFLMYYTYRYVASDITFEKSVISASKNLGSQTYDYQNSAITLFPYRDGYYRVFSQTNIAIAAYLANQQKNNQNNSQTQNTAYQLIQQAINAGKAATVLAPNTVQNWQNLSSIYRGLIGFGQNADNFAILTSQQAIALDQNNPQEHIILGGIYYQLGQWDNAQREFLLAVSLKPDYANAYYNLGHALENKGDLNGALNQYKTVKTLIAKDLTNSKKIQEEIDAVEKKMQTGTTAQSQPNKVSENTSEKLGISSPAAQLPEKKPPVVLPAPIGTNSASPK